MNNRRCLPAVYVQGPWADMLINGDKVIETRTRSIPNVWIGQELWLIQTGYVGSSKIIGIIKFSGSKKYDNITQWRRDKKLHRVKEQAGEAWQWHPDKKLYGWIVESVKKIKPVWCCDVENINHRPGGVYTPFCIKGY